MLPRRIAHVVISVAVGFASALLLYRLGSSSNDAAPNDYAREENTGESSVGSVRTLEPATGSIGAQTQEGHTTAGDQIHPADPVEAMKGYTDAARAFARQRERDRLYAAGFTEDRIRWLEKRAADLRAQDEEYWKSRATAGVAPSEGAADRYRGTALTFDRDLGLLEEIGEDEYDRYRQALGRPLGIALVDVVSGSIAQGSGLLPGDEITRYDGERVYSAAMLSGAVERNTSGGSATIEVRRDGRLMQLSLPRGDLEPMGIRCESPVEATARTRMEVLGLPKAKTPTAN